MLKEFREFIAKGNVLDLAVGIIIGAAFTAIVNSFVQDIVNPIIGLAGKANFDNMFVVMRDGAQPGPYTTPQQAEEAGAVVLKYGAFLTNVINFMIVAWVVFLVVKSVNRYRSRLEQPADASVAGPTKQEVLLTEIRDALRSRAL